MLGELEGSELSVGVSDLVGTFDGSELRDGTSLGKIEGLELLDGSLLGDSDGLLLSVGMSLFVGRLEG